jgi:hypothetical protein
LGTAIDAVVGYSRSYTADPGLLGWIERPLGWLDTSIRTVFAKQFVALSLLAWIPVLAFTLLRRDTRSSTRRLTRWASIAVPIGVVLMSTSGRHYAHYALALIPALTVLVAFVVSRLSRGLREMSVSRRALLVSALSAGWMTLLVVVLLRPALLAARSNDQSLHDLAAGHIIATTDAEEPIWVWGAESLVYLLADRDSPSHYFYQLPLMTEGWVTDELVATVVGELEANPPALIVDVSDPVMPPLDGSERAGFQASLEYTADVDVLRPLFEFVETHYVPGPDLGPWATYDLR